MGKSEKRRKTELLVVRCTPWEMQTIDLAAKESGMSRSEFVRNAALVRAEDVLRGAA
ncbi:plasmid mobilization protein [Amycolatopsis thailandensis]|uniref:plasmid mobilization protein n=1 Tax=Amycolatopsis thailandensis TaxID=589330 RepID=UPI0037A01D06